MPQGAFPLSRTGILSRRRLLLGAGASALAWTPLLRANASAPEVAPDGFRVLRLREGLASLRGTKETPTPIWGYDGTCPGPTLRVQQGGTLRVRIVNELRQPHVVHWHGLRLPNAMDGVPHLTQMPIEPGASFDYSFAAPDAGTFWYHTHFLSSEQLERGLYGVLIVEEPAPVAVDRDVTLVVDDWRLTEGGAISPGFGNLHDAAMAGRLGQYITLNSENFLHLPVRSNERLRLRLVNTANARIFKLRIADHAMRMMALDGQPCAPETAPDGTVRLGPGGRADLFLDATLAPNASAAILVDDLRGGELEVGRLVYDPGPPVRERPLGEPAPLPANPLPQMFDLTGALKVDVPLEGGMQMMMRRRMGGGDMMPGAAMGASGFAGHGLTQQERIWALAGSASTGHDGPPMFKVARGRTVVLAFGNRSVFPHAMHVHGHHFRRLDGDALGPHWLDSLIVDAERTERVVFVADNPGKWMLHCHMIEHMAAGMAAWFEVT